MIGIEDFQCRSLCLGSGRCGEEVKDKSDVKH
jgi:hypothetical protein